MKLPHPNALDEAMFTVQARLHDAYHFGTEPLPLNGDHFVTGASGVPIHYRSYVPDLGQPIRGTVIAVHGAAHNSGFYHDFGLMARHYGWAVHAIDLPGHGRSYYQPHYDYNSLCDEVVHVIHQLEPQQETDEMAYIGTSLGGQLRMVMAVRGIQFKATVLNDIGPKIAAYVHASVVHNFHSIEPMPLDQMMEKAYKRYRHYGLGNSVGTQEFIQDSIRLCGSTDTPQAQYRLDPNFASLYTSLPETPFANVHEYYETEEGVFIGSDFSAGFDQINEPLLMLRGAESQFFDADQCRVVKDFFATKGMTVIEVPNVKHPVGLENGAMNKRICDFFACYVS